ncbi:MAG: SRPBCC family protein [Myxococcota bacterium]
MVWVKRGGLGCGGLIALFVLFVLSGFLLPRELQLSTQREVSLGPDAVFAKVSSPAGVQAWWAPIADKAVQDGYPRMDVVPLDAQQVAFEAGGYRMETWTLKQAEPTEVVWDVDFGMLVVERTLVIEPSGAGSKLTWTETADVGNPLLRWMARVSDPTPNFQDAMAGLEL